MVGSVLHHHDLRQWIGWLDAAWLGLSGVESSTVGLYPNDLRACLVQAGLSGGRDDARMRPAQLQGDQLGRVAADDNIIRLYDPLMSRPRLSKDRIPTYTPAEGVSPVCPHCSETVEGVYQQRIDEPLGKVFIWFCMNCRKTLGISHRKGFWMG